MNLIDTRAAMTYPDSAGLLHVNDEHYAYMVLGRTDQGVLVVEGQGDSKGQAVHHLMRKLSLLKDYMNVMAHEGFWRVIVEQAKQQGAEFAKMLGITLPEGDGSGSDGGGELPS